MLARDGGWRCAVKIVIEKLLDMDRKNASVIKVNSYA